jgi:hypothetical protein
MGEVKELRPTRSKHLDEDLVYSVLSEARKVHGMVQVTLGLKDDRDPFGVDPDDLINFMELLGDHLTSIKEGLEEAFSNMEAGAVTEEEE